MSTRCVLPLGLCALLFVFALTASADETADRRRDLRQAQEGLRDRDWRNAAQALRVFRLKHVGTAEAIEAWVLEADALLRSGAAREALDTASGFLSVHGARAWAGRVQHTVAEAYEKLAQHASASGILHALADASTSHEARARIAALHLELADQDFDGVETKDDLGRTKRVRNVARAYGSYGHALTVGLEPGARKHALARRALALEAMNKYAEAASAWNVLLKEAGHEKTPAVAELPADEAEAVGTWLVGRGRSYLRSGNRPLARADLKAALGARRESEHHMEILLLLGEERLAAAKAGAGDGAFEEGVAYMRRAIREHRDEADAVEAQKKLAAAYEARGQSEKAASEWLALTLAFPEADFVPEARNRAALALERAGRHDHAIREWQVFWREHPTHPLWTQVRESILRASFARGAARMALGNVDSAIRAWDLFAQENPDDGRAPQALMLAAAAQRSSKASDAAIATWRRVAGRYAPTPHAPAARLMIAIVLEDDRQQLDEAIAAYEEVIKLHPRTPQSAQAQLRLQRLREKHLQVRMERILASSEPPVLRVETRNIESLRVRVYRLSLEEYFARKGTLSGVENLQLEIVKPDWTRTWTIDGYKPHYRIEADRPLPLEKPGAYVVVAGDDDLTCTTLFLISDIECVVKKAEGHQLFVWAFDRKTHAPIEGARVIAAGAGEVGRTGPDGVWQGGGRKITRTRNVLVLSDRGTASTEIKRGGRVEAGFRSKAYVYTDRPVYRPGSTVQWRALFLRAGGGGYHRPAKGKGRVRIYDPRGQEVHSAVVTSSDFGSFSGSYAIDEAAPLGAHRIQISVHRHGSWEGTFEVQEFRKPEFTVEVKPRKRVYLTGEPVEADIALQYAFGGAVANAPVRYEVWRFRRTFEPSTSDDYGWYFKDDRPRKQARAKTAGGTRVAAGTTRTNAAGRAEIRFETREADEDAEYVVRASAQDVTRRWVLDEGRVPVTRRDHMAVVKSDRKVYRPKQEVRVDVRTVDAREHALPRSGVLHLMQLRRSTRPIDAKIRGGRRPAVVHDEEVEVRQFSLTTDAKGQAELRFSIEKPGRYRLRWRGTSRGQLVTAYTDIEASGEAEDLSKDARLVAARSLYNEGEKAEVLLSSPVSRGKALLTYEGERVLDYRFIDLSSGTTLLDLPLEGRHAPNVFFKIAIPGAEKLIEAQTEVVVLRHLDVSVAISPETALPGAEVEVTVTARDANGKPVKAELGIGLVDETVFAVSPDAAPPIRPFFYDKRRKNAVVTASSVGTRFYGTTRMTSKDLLTDAAARAGNARAVQAQSALRLAREAQRRGDMATAVRQALAAMAADPQSWDARAMLSALRVNEAARRHLERATAARPKAKPAASKDRREAADDAPFEGPTTAAMEPVIKDEEMQDFAANGTIGIGGGAGGAFRGRGGSRSLGTGGGGRAARKIVRSAGVDALMADKKSMRNQVAALGKLHKGLAALVGKQRADELIGYTEIYNSQFTNFGGLAGFEVRKQFADTAAWQPHVVTGEDGTATIKVELPDNLTTWRATVRGVSTEALVGSGRGSVVARRNVLLRVDPPRFLTQGDVVTVPSAVHNNTEDDLDLTVRVEAEGVELSGADETLSIPPGSRRISDRVLSATHPGPVRIEASVGAGLIGDAVEVKLGTIARGLKTFEGRSGMVSTSAADETEVFFDVPANVVSGTNRLSVVLYPGIDDALMDALLYLGLFPYGCIEQTVHRFLPALEARAALTSAGSADAARIEALREAAQRGAQRLRNVQNADGSFGWFRGGRPDLAMTGYALRGLVAARAAGISGLNRVIDKAAAALVRMNKAGPEDVRALAHLALASLGKVDTEAYATTYRRRSDDLSVAGLAWLALAADRLKRSFDRDELVRLILARRTETDDGLTRWAGRQGSCFTGSDAEATGLAVQALIVTRTATPHAERGLRWLLAQRAAKGVGTTKATAAFVGAAAAWVAQGRTQGFGGAIDVLLDGKVVRTVKTGAHALDVNDRRFFVKEATALTTGRHTLGLRLRGQGEVRFAARMESVVESEKLPGEEHGMRLERTYLAPAEATLPGQPARIKPGYTILRPSAQPKIEAQELSQVAAGDRVLVRLRINVPRDLEYVLVEDPLPAGFEVLDDTSKGPFEWQERRDNRQVFFLSRVPKGHVILEYILQATHLGRFTALGTTAYAMYAPEIHARADGTSIRIAAVDDVHAPGTENEPTPDETYALAKLLLDAEDYTSARPLLTELRQEQPLRDEIIEEIEVHLLRAAIAEDDAKEVVRAREELVRRGAGRIPGDLDTARAIAFAYEDIGEHEVAGGLMRGLVARGFGLETGWADTLKARGREVEALDRLGTILRRFPVSNATGQAAFQRAQRYRELQRPAGRAGEAGRPMDDETLDAMWSVTAHFAGTALAGPANYALVDAMRQAGDLGGAATSAEAFLRRFPKSHYVDDAWFFLADVRFRRFEEAPTDTAATQVRAAAEPLVKRRFPRQGREPAYSPFRGRAYHILARVHHVRGELDAAIPMYKRAGNIEDAREALAFLTQERLMLDETVTRPLGEKTSFPVRYRNVKKASFKAYPVDLQVLFAVRKTLEGLHKIDLSGILPAHQWTETFDDAGDHGEHAAAVTLPVAGKKPGVWLVVAKAGRHEASSLVIETDLKVVLQRLGKKVRIYVTDASGAGLRGAYVTVSNGSQIRARGLTDGRGVFEAPGVGSTAFVVVSAGDRYAIAR